ncbi:membrane-targeted effector domain-containing toxin [Pseudomonas sp. CCI2.4]|uniref:membrane-targeted effector domain-containing toxin n=1 Tax=Pseudomonas sp. CCI2.4 TaxID=3048617 RepID=UPI002B23AD59|nr:membrane-targeted effector domain-containing toxin [Pseudomonas sp. CCI2.4]MEB0129076.1 membrane-targeted effector domain-containing toxin [Pseudomonas sp. CCI2.4]
MPSTETSQPSSIASAVQLALNSMGQRLVWACPDMLQMARDAAKEILEKHVGFDIEPDQVYWHRFTTSVSSPRTFNGWQHFDPPVESLTLPQLVMRRFYAHDQDDVLDLQVTGGFYTAGPSAQVFNETNEIRILPANVLSDLWQIDFSARYTAKLNDFWQDYADDFRTMAKANFLAKALEERDSGWLSERNFNTVVKATCGSVTWPVSLEQLRSASPSAANLRVCTFDIAGIVSSNILRIVDASGRQLLYVPGDMDAFHVFENPDDLHWWVMSQTSRAPNRAEFMAHFPLSSHLQTDSAVGLNHLIDLVFSQWGAPGPSLINRNDHGITGDAFNWMRDAAKNRMADDAYVSLHSNADLRKQMWIGFLSNFSRVASGMATLDWPVALVAVGAGLTNTGMNIDQAVNGHTTAERKAGVVGAILSSVDALFNAPFLAGLEAEPAEREAALEQAIPEEEDASFEPIDYRGLVADVVAIAPGPVYPVSTDALLAPFETNTLLEDFAPTGEGRMRGVCVLDKGETYISISDVAYRVRYVDELKSWVVVDPAQPYSFYRNLPVRLNELGGWEPSVGNGLKGGGKVFGRLPWGQATEAAIEAEPFVSSYEVWDSEKADLKIAAGGADNKVLSGERQSLDPTWHDPYVNFRAIRTRLLEDASAFYAHPNVPLKPEIPVMDPTTVGTYRIKKIFQKSAGLVIGESHASIGSKQLLIENMPQLAKLKVKTLYMEHLLTDFHQVDLDTFSRTGSMPKGLERYLKDLDTGHRTDPSGQYTFLAVVKVANENHIRVRALDCMASYRLAGMPDQDGLLRQKVMNYFARTVIDADKTARGATKWIALVGSSHASNYKGVPGISELEGAISLRIEDVDEGQSSGIEIDPGKNIPIGFGSETGFVKRDLRLQVELGISVTPLDSAASRLTKAGMFTLSRSGQQLTLIHRSSSNTLVFTVIHSEGGHYYLERPKWPYVSGRRFDSTRELVKALKLMGMKWVH